VEQARLQLAWTHIAAPAAGVVARKSVQVGRLVRPGQALMAVVPLDGVWVSAMVVQRVPVRIRLSGNNPRAGLRPGMSSEVTVEKRPKGEANRADREPGRPRSARRRC
jgi:membrane fusion protein, multidrug efflux system